MARLQRPWVPDEPPDTLSDARPKGLLKAAPGALLGAEAR
jgi:hypothetical protein